MPVTKQNYTWTEIKAGIMVLVSLVLFALFFAVVKGMRMPEKNPRYYVYFSDTLGLNKGADVRYGGARVGRVTNIRLDPENQSQIVVEFEVDPEVPINEESMAHVGQVTLTAEKHLEISTGSEHAQRKPPESVIASRQRDLFGMAGEVGGKVAKVLDAVSGILGVEKYAVSPEAADTEGQEELVSVPDILKNVDGAVGDIRGILGDNREAVGAIVAKLHEIEDSAKDLVEQLNTLIAENKPDIRGVVEGVHSTVDSAEKAVEQVDGILKEVAAATARLDQLADSLQAALDNAEALSADVRGLTHETRPQIEDLIADLRETARYAKEFARAVAEQPQAVIRGQRPQGRLSERE